MKTSIQDLRFGLRTLVHNPTFSLLAVLILALGIGLSTAIFTMVNALFFSSLPIKNGDTLAFPVAVNPQLGIQRGDISIPDFMSFREQVSAFRQLGAVHQDGELILTGEGEPIRLRPGAGQWNTRHRLIQSLGLWGDRICFGSFRACRRLCASTPSHRGRAGGRPAHSLAS